jgi:hypothetical protein
MLDQLTVAAAHELAAMLVRQGIAPPEVAVTGSARIEHAGILVVVTVAKHEVMRLHLTEEGKRRLGIDGLTDADETIIEAAPSANEKPITLKQLAKAAGYSYSDWFRGRVDSLVIAGVLVRSSHGIRKAG